MEDYDIGKLYEKFGRDYKIKITPINSHIYQNISTYIDFSNCKNLLREANGYSSSDLLTVFQIEIYNPHNQTLIDNVEYAVFKNIKKN